MIGISKRVSLSPSAKPFRGLWLIIAILPALLVSGCDKREAPDNVVGQKIKAGALIVDVRSPEEVSQGMYPGAVNIPIEQVEKRVSEFGAKDRSIVLYCRSGSRASSVKQFLKTQGYTDVTNAGGIGDMPTIK